MPVRSMRAKDRPQVLALMQALWPEESDFLEGRETVWVWEALDRNLGGFISFSIRPYANGCDSAPVPFVEGWYVLPAWRRQGVGKELMSALEAWCLSKGYRELGSDTELWRRRSIVVHQALGFELTERIQYFRKWLGGRQRAGISRPAAARSRAPARPRRGSR